MRTTIPALLLVSLSLAAFPAGAARIVHVRAGGTGAGTSWADAYGDLQAALAAAQAGDEIWVGEGTWLPGPAGDLEATFVLRDSVALYGGFAGDEAFRDQRDPVAHRTTLSGDLGSDDVYDPWPSGWNIGTANAKHVVTAEGVGAGAVLDGFTVMAGYVVSELGGGGAAITNAAPTIQGCRFVHNLAGFTHGGAIRVAGASPAILDCAFVQNYAHLGNGAGIDISGASAPVIERCSFSGNIAVGSDPTGDGGAIAIHSDGVALRWCTFEDNVSKNFYATGDSDLGWGGAVFNFADGLTIDSCVFRRNHAHAGGGVASFGDQVTIANSLFEGNIVTSYAVGGGGDGGDFGGGYSGISFNGETTRIVNCVFSRNQAGEGAGIATFYGHLVELRNTIVWGNVATGQDVTHLDGQIKADADYRCSCVEALFEQVPGEDPPDPANFPGCIDADPRFVAPASGDLRLRSDSPCIDAAENSMVPPFVTLDLDGYPRRFDDPGTEDGGIGTAPIVDMGPYEYGSATVDVVDPGEGVARGGLLASPNPSPGAVRLSWGGALAAPGMIEVFDAAGRRIRALPVPPGAGGIEWDGRTAGGARLAGGVYYARLRDPAGARAAGRVLLVD